MKPKTVSSLKKRLDKLFSVFIRQRGMNWKGENTCFICGKRDQWKRLQHGHFVGRADNNLRYDEVNCQVCCVGCNVFKVGNMVLYAIKMKEKYGEGIIEKLWKRSQEPKNWKVSELEKLIKKYSISA